MPRAMGKPVKTPDGRGAAEGLTLDNLEDKMIALQNASAPTRNSKRRRDEARLQKKREEHAQAKLAAPLPQDE
jgi:hypothetical protein